MASVLQSRASPKLRSQNQYNIESTKQDAFLIRIPYILINQWNLF